MYGKHELPHKPEMIPNTNTNAKKNHTQKQKIQKHLCVNQDALT